MTDINKVGVYLSHPDAKMPTRAYDGDVGFDLYAVEDVTIPVGTAVEVKTGVHFKLPEQMFAQVNTRSSYGKNGLFVHHGVIDSGYTGEVSIFIFNACDIVDVHGMLHKESKIIKKGEKIAQILFHEAERPELEQIEKLPNTERGEKGFGSSGQ